MVIMSTNEYLITSFSGPEGVVDYQIYHKLFALGSTIFSLALTPIWSLVTRAIAEKDFAWVNKLYKRLCLFGLLGTFCEFLIVPFAQIGVDIWMGDQSIKMIVTYSLLFALMASLMLWNSILSSIANGIGKLVPQSICFATGAVAKIPLAWIFVILTGSWIGVLIANIIPMLFYCVVEALALKKYFREIN